MRMRIVAWVLLILTFSGGAFGQQAAAGRIFIVREVRFRGIQHLSKDEQQRLAGELENAGYSGRTWVSDLSNKVRALLQEHGYFRSEVNATVEEMPGSTAEAANCTLTFTAAEGPLYRLGHIEFRSPSSVFVPEELRGYIALADGDVLDSTKLLAGLDAIRAAYGRGGYVKFDLYPGFEFDEKRHLAFLDVFWTEGKQYRLGRVEFSGPDPSQAETLRSRFPLQPGDIFDTTQVDAFYRDNDMLLPALPRDNYAHQTIDDKTGTVNLKIQIPQPAGAN